MEAWLLTCNSPRSSAWQSGWMSFVPGSHQKLANLLEWMENLDNEFRARWSCR